jgi:hypothetical protein
MSSKTQQPRSEHDQAPVGAQQSQRSEQGAAQEQGTSNSEQLDALGLQGGSAGTGELAPVEQLDPGLALELGGNMTVAENVLADRSPVLAGQGAEADVQGTYDVLDYIRGTVAELQSAIDADDAEAQAKLLVDLELYRANLVDGTTVVEAEGDTHEQLAAFGVETGIAALCAMRVGMSELIVEVEEMVRFEDLAAMYMGRMEAAQRELQDQRVAVIADSLVGSFNALLMQFSGPCRACGIVVNMALDLGGTITSDMLKAAFSEGGEGFDALDTAVAAGDGLSQNMADGLAQLAGLGGISEKLIEARGLYDQLGQAGEILGALEEFREAAAAIMQAAHDSMNAPLRKVEARLGELADEHFETIHEHLLMGGEWVRDTCYAHYEAAQEVRMRNPGRYDPV